MGNKIQMGILMQGFDNLIKVKWVSKNQTKESQSAITSEKALEILTEVNARFVQSLIQNRNCGSRFNVASSVIFGN